MGDAHTVTEFIHKYQIDAFGSVILRSLLDSIEYDSVGVYAITVTNGHRDIGAKAARATLKPPISRL